MEQTKRAASAARAVQSAQKILERCQTRDPIRIAHELGITVFPRAFVKQKGVYMVIAGNRYIFIKNDLPESLYSLVLLHEIGHDVLHRRHSMPVGGFREYNLFDMQDKAFEYEANMFAAQIVMPDDETLELIRQGYRVDDIAAYWKTDANLVALKVSELIARGYSLRMPGYDARFLTNEKENRPE